MQTTKRTQKRENAGAVSKNDANDEEEGEYMFLPDVEMKG